MLNVDHETEVDFVDDFNLFNKALRGQILDHCVMSWDVHFSTQEMHMWVSEYCKTIIYVSK